MLNLGKNDAVLPKTIQLSYIGFRSDYLVKCKKKGQITWFSKK
jgi:hypothetical protein